MTSNGNGQTYAWDAENRLVKITQGGNTYQFGYDALGRRISETDNGTLSKEWIWSGTTMAEERNSSNTVTKRFYPQGEQISGSSYYDTFDHLGSIREMTNSSGVIQARYDYDPFGRVTLVSGTNLSDFQYAGYYTHQASGLNLTMWRAYDPNTARWLSRDPIGENGGINLYDYVGNDVINKIDPDGQQAALIGAAAGLGLLIIFEPQLEEYLEELQKEQKDKQAKDQNKCANSSGSSSSNTNAAPTNPIAPPSTDHTHEEHEEPPAPEQSSSAPGPDPKDSNERSEPAEPAP